MVILEYFESNRQPELLQQLRECDWESGKLLVRLLEANSFQKTLGGAGKLFLLVDGERIVSFLTLTRQDCVAAPDWYPWIGFVYTFPAYRGRRCVGALLEHAIKCAAEAGFPFVFLATGHVGLYEKYGFSYWGTRPDIYGENSRIYTAPAADILSTAETARQQAEKVIRQSGVSEAWEAIGAEIHPVGSMAMGLLMKHRDIDFHIYTDTLCMEKSFKVIGTICNQLSVTRMEYRNSAATEEKCFEWHIWHLQDEQEWQIDLIQILRGSRFDGFFEHVAERIKAVLTPETRRSILGLKYLTPETEYVMGIQYYQAVIADGVRTYPEFVEWQKFHPANGINSWCP